MIRPGPPQMSAARPAGSAAALLLLLLAASAAPAAARGLPPDRPPEPPAGQEADPSVSVLPTADRPTAAPIGRYVRARDGRRVAAIDRHQLLKFRRLVQPERLWVERRVQRVSGDRVLVTYSSALTAAAPPGELPDRQVTADLEAASQQEQELAPERLEAEVEGSGAGGGGAPAPAALPLLPLDESGDEPPPDGTVGGRAVDSGRAANEAAAAPPAGLDEEAGPVASDGAHAARPATRDVDKPPAGELPVDEPSVKEPPADEPSVNEPPVDEPLVDEPPADEPSVGEPPADESPVDQRPVDESPVDEPPVDESPADEPPVDGGLEEAPLPGPVGLPAGLVPARGAASPSAGGGVRPPAESEFRQPAGPGSGRPPPEDASDTVRREARGSARPAAAGRLGTAEISAVAVGCVTIAAVVILAAAVLVQRSGMLKRRSILSDPPLDDTRLSYINASTDFSVSDLGDEMTNLENLDNDSFLNSLESMTDSVTAQTCWSREVRHSKL